MKNPIVRIPITAILFSLAAGIAVTVAGLLLRWKTYTQFSDGFFWTGAIMVSIGLVNLLGQGARILFPGCSAASQQSA